MSQVVLNQFFNLQPAQQNIKLPKRELFTVLPRQQNYDLERLTNLNKEVETFQSLQNRFEDATTHEKRDKIIACIIGATLVGLVAGTVLGFLFCPPVGIVCASLLFVLGFICSAATAHIASKDHRNGYEIIKYADMLGIGWPRIITYLLTRKVAMENNREGMKELIANDLVNAGRYLRENESAIKEKLKNDVGFAIPESIGHFSPAIQAALNQFFREAQKSRGLLEELDKGMSMVNSMIQANLLDPS